MGGGEGQLHSAVAMRIRSITRRLLNRWDRKMVAKLVEL
jgi:hypothetical protein